MLTFKVSLGGRYRNANGGDVTPAKQAFVGTEQINNKRTCCVRLNSNTILGPSRYTTAQCIKISSANSIEKIKATILTFLNLTIVLHSMS